MIDLDVDSEGNRESIDAVLMVEGIEVSLVVIRITAALSKGRNETVRGDYR